MENLKRKPDGTHLEEHVSQGVLYFTFPSLSELPFVIHGFSSRIGGVSKNEFSSMNLSFTRGDDPDCVRENFRRISSSIGFEEDRMVFSYQTHTTNVLAVTKEDCGKGFIRERDYQDVDALITDDPDVILTAFFADCVPLYFVDPVHRAVALAHSGWRGTVHNIADVVVKALHERYGSDPSDLIAAIGPSICQDCYEVEEDVIQEFCSHYPKALWPALFRQENEKKYHLNLWEACRQNLLGAGLEPDHIAVTDLCTCCNPDIFFSHRASKGKRGNLAAFLGIRSLQGESAQSSIS